MHQDKLYLQAKVEFLGFLSKLALSAVLFEFNSAKSLVDSFLARGSSTGGAAGVGLLYTVPLAAASSVSCFTRFYSATSAFPLFFICFFL
jgi:hypothetical protein